MATEFFPPELDYTLPPQPQRVIKNRSEVVQTNVQTYSNAGGKIIEFQINSDAIIDPSSINLYWQMQSNLTANGIGAGTFYYPGARAGDIANGPGLYGHAATDVSNSNYATKYTMCSSWELAYNIIISTPNGQIIENIQNASLLGRFISRTTAPAWNNTVLSFTNSYHNALDNNNCDKTLGTDADYYYTYKMQFIELCGFLQISKYLNLGLMGGGLKISIQLESSPHIYVTHNPDDSVKLNIKNPRITYDVINVADAVLDGMRQLSLNGFSFSFNTWGYTNMNLTSLANVRLSLNASNISRCKCIVMAMRNIAARDSYVYDSCAVLSDLSKLVTKEMEGSYYIEIGGVRYGSYVGIDSPPRAYDQILKSTYLKKHSQCALYDYQSATTDWQHTNSSCTVSGITGLSGLAGGYTFSVATDGTITGPTVVQGRPAATATITQDVVSQKFPDKKRTNGNNFMVIDLEKMSSTGESGVTLDSNVIIGLNFPNNTTSNYVGSVAPATKDLIASFGSTNNQTTLDVFYCYEVICHVLPGGGIKIDT